MKLSPLMRKALVYTFILVIIVLGTMVIFFGKNYWADRRYVHYVVKKGWEYWRAPLSHAYVDQVAYQTGDSLRLYARAEKDRPFWIYLYDILGQVQDSLLFPPRKQTIGPNPSVKGFGFSEGVSYKVPSLKPGLYTWEKVAPFIIRGPTKAPITVLYPINTIQAYNTQGGKSFYSMFSEATDTVSLLRPTFPAISFMVFPMLEWLHQQDFPLRFITDIDLEDPYSLDSTDVLLVIGHSEYWSGDARNTFDSFVDKGGNVLIMSGNTLWWKIRYTTDKQQIICFKNGNDPVDDPKDRTGNWADHLGRDPRSSIGVSFALGGYGRKYPVSKGGFTLLDTHHVLFKEVNFGGKPFIHVPSKEYDGQHILTQGENVSLDPSQIGFSQYKLLGYDGASHGYDPTMASILLFQKSDTSGVILNFPTTDWCSPYGIGGKDGEKIKTITLRAIDLLWHHNKTSLLWE